MGNKYETLVCAYDACAAAAHPFVDGKRYNFSINDKTELLAMIEIALNSGYSIAIKNGD